MSIQRDSEVSCRKHSPTNLLPNAWMRDSPVSGSFGGESFVGRSGRMLYHLLGSSSIGSAICDCFNSITYVFLIACERIQIPRITANIAHHDMSNLIPKSCPASVTMPQISTRQPISNGQKWKRIRIVLNALEIAALRVPGETLPR